MLSVNPALNTNRPAEKKAKVEVLSTEDQIKLFEYLRNDTIGVIIKLALVTGCRIGELLGLKWENVDFQKLEINLRQGLVWNYEFDDENHTGIKNGVKLADLKTETSIRIIPITVDTANMLMEYRMNQKIFCPKFPADEPFEPEMVFLSEAGSLLDISNVRKRYARILRDLNIPFIKFHTLRHTFATRLLENGVHPKIAQTLLGHSEMRTSMEIYSHVLPSMTREAIDKIQGLG